MNMFERQILEINKHRWIESEKAGYDVGEEWAAMDWVSKYAAKFRVFWTIVERNKKVNMLC